MDEGMFLNISNVVQDGDAYFFVRNNETDILVQDDAGYIDGLVDAYFEDVQNWYNNQHTNPNNTLPRHPNNHKTYEIFSTEIVSKGFNIAPNYQMHRKSWRSALVHTGVFSQNVDLIVEASVDGSPKLTAHVIQ